MPYSTYVVNQSDQDIWVWEAFGEAGAGWSRSEHVAKGQNVAFGRGGLCISGVGFSTSSDQDSIKTTWPNGRIDGCLSWGFRIGPGLEIVETMAWAVGQAGMIAEWPPTKVVMALHTSG